MLEIMGKKIFNNNAENFCLFKPRFSLLKVNKTHDLWTLQKEEERLRASTKRESLKRRVRERAHAKGLSAGYLEGDEEDEEDEDISISAIKNKYKQTGKKGTGKFWTQTNQGLNDLLSSMWKGTQNAYCLFHQPLTEEHKNITIISSKLSLYVLHHEIDLTFGLFMVNIYL